ncbi:hypothetical protein ZWY2020_016769 [Hordeum vulgare]|nr:hypothetical protein ZWY2020_016769 [Hordeum vulgare]
MYQSKQLLLTNFLEAVIVTTLLGTIYINAGYGEAGAQKRLGLFAFTLMFVTEWPIVLAETAAGLYLLAVALLLPRHRRHDGVHPVPPGGGAPLLLVRLLPRRSLRVAGGIRSVYECAYTSDARTRVHPAHPRRSPPATHQADPGVLLLDEPTSGLDSSSAFVVVGCLRGVAAARGTTVVLSIHQPSARLLSAVDSLLLLSRGTVLHHGSLASFDAALLSHGFAIPAQLNPLEYALEVID